MRNVHRTRIKMSNVGLSVKRLRHGLYGQNHEVNVFIDFVFYCYCCLLLRVYKNILAYFCERQNFATWKSFSSCSCYFAFARNEWHRPKASLRWLPTVALYYHLFWCKRRGLANVRKKAIRVPKASFTNNINVGATIPKIWVNDQQCVRLSAFFNYRKLL